MGCGARSGCVQQVEPEQDARSRGAVHLLALQGIPDRRLRDDCVLVGQLQATADLIRRHLEQFIQPEPNYTSADLEKLEALLNQLSKTYVGDALNRVREIVNASGRELFELESISTSLVSELRTRGWSDSALADGFHEARGCAKAEVDQLQKLVTAAPKNYVCYVVVAVNSALFRQKDEDFTVVSKLDEPPKGFPATGPYLRVRVDSLDTRAAARFAIGRVSSVLGAMAVFSRSEIGVRSSVVAVHSGNQLVAIKTDERFPNEYRQPTSGQLERVLRSALDTKSLADDPVFEAIRFRQRALDHQSDIDSRFMLLWLGMERLLQGRNSGAILDVARAVVPKALSLGKLRSDLADLASAIDRAPLSQDRRAKVLELAGQGRTVSREKLLKFLLADESGSREFTATFYDVNVHLTQWYCVLRKRIGGGTTGPIGPKIHNYLETARLRLDRQVTRLYRARNSLAHAAGAPRLIEDLFRHANAYLTNLIALCVHQRESEPQRSASSILLNRAGQFDAYLSLLRAENPHSTEISALIRPTSLVGL